MPASPTGRNPVLLWTSARQAVWDQMKADYVAEGSPASPVGLGAQFYRYQLDSANTAIGSDYGISPFAQAWMYHATGDPAWAELAYDKLVSNFFTRSGYNNLGGNYIREYGTEMVVIYDWIRHGITEAHRAAVMSKINEMVTLWCVSNVPTDSDQLVGNVLCAAAWHLASNDHNATDTTIALAANGGLVATGALTDRSNNRNSFRWLHNVTVEGGMWCEGTEYNIGTQGLSVFGSEAVRTAPGASTYFQESVDLWPDLANAFILNGTPDMQRYVEWGDHIFQRGTMTGGMAYITTSTLMLLAGGLQGTTMGPYIQRFLLNQISANGGLTGIGTLRVRTRGWATFNPYATAAADLSGLSNTWYGAGQGQLTMRHGWNATTDSLFWGSIFPITGGGYQHSIHWFKNFQVYRQGEWAMTYPVAYGQFPDGEKSSTWPDQTNSTLIHGIASTLPVSGFGGYRSVRGHKLGSNYVYIVGTQGATPWDAGTYNPPPLFLHEHTPSLLYLQGATKQSDVVVVFDRINAEDPQTKLKFDRYRTASTPERSLIINAFAPKQMIFHCNEAPTVNGVPGTHNLDFPSAAGSIEWVSLGGDLDKIEPLLPTNKNVRVLNDTTYGAYASTTQLKWAVRIWPMAEQQWDVFLNVFSARNTGTAVTSTLIQDTVNKAHGALITRTGENDVVVVFNGVQGPNLPDYPPAPNYSSEILDTVRLRDTSYTVGWTQTTTTCEIFLCDLDPETVWNYSIDGNPDAALTVDENGLAVFTHSGTGAHVLEVIGSGSAPPVEGPPGPITNQVPANNTIDVSLTPTLAWDSLQATSYDVYFGAVGGGGAVPTSLTRTPTGDGVTTTWTANTGTTYEAVADSIDTPDDDTTFISKTASNGAHLFTYAAISLVGGSTIQSVQVTTRHKRTGTSWTRSAQIRVGGSVYTSSTSTVSSATYVTVTTTWVLSPATGLAWTVDEINTGLTQFGLGCTGNTTAGDVASCTQCYLTVNYTPGTGGPVLVLDDVSVETYQPGDPVALIPNTVYQWRVIATNIIGPPVTGPLNAFTTTTSPGPDEETFPREHRGSHKRLLKTIIS